MCLGFFSLSFLLFLWLYYHILFLSLFIFYCFLFPGVSYSSFFLFLSFLLPLFFVSSPLFFLSFPLLSCLSFITQFFPIFEFYFFIRFRTSAELRPSSVFHPYRFSSYPPPFARPLLVSFILLSPLRAPLPPPPPPASEVITGSSSPHYLFDGVRPPSSRGDCGSGHQHGIPAPALPPLATPRGAPGR